MHFVRPFFFLPYLFPSATWRKEKNKNNIYLTFDDGPIPEITPWILDCLKEKDVKACFFCVGDNVRKSPELYQRILDEGHQVGNHTFNHLKGWDQEDSNYLDNIAQCRTLVDSQLFRPPYGRLKKSQLSKVSKDYEVIMWDVLTGDYDKRISPEQCLNNAVNYSRAGSIIVFHDNIKAIANLQYALPRTIDQLRAKGYQFQLL